jgi:acyl transferase domain-containing protein
MTDDYQKNVSKDPETMARLNLAGNAMAILPNRISWTFDLAGPSVHVDTACSSSLVALDLACQSLRSGDATAALVTGANVILGPECSLLVSNLNFLSPASLCRSFDAKADGYARGEGVIAMLLKPVSQALADGDAIRAVIRATGSNQDGHTPVLTQPSLEAQERLIRHVYQKAGLDFARTRYVEAHGP